MIHKPLPNRHPNGLAAYKMISSKANSVAISHLGPKDFKLEGDWFIPQKWFMNSYVLSPNITNQSFLYRGEAVDLDENGDVPLKYTSYHKIQNNEVDRVYFRIRLFDLSRLLASNPLFRMLRRGVKFSEKDNSKFCLTSFALLHSYGIPSTYLSLTSDLKIALFYAVTDYDDRNRRYVPTKKKYGILSHYNLTKPIDISSRIAPVGLHVFERPSLNREFVCRLRGEETFYTLPNVDGYLFEQNVDLSERILQDFDYGRALNPENDILYGRIKESEGIFTERSYRIVSRIQSYAHAKMDDLREKYILSDDDNYYFNFSREEIEMHFHNVYYWWYEFCNKIYFKADPRFDEQYIQHLPYNEEYSKYFDSCLL